MVSRYAAAPKLILIASCGIEPKRIAPYKPLIDAAISLAESKPSAMRLCGAESGRRSRTCRSGAEIVTLVRDKIGPVAAFKIAIVVRRLPKTRFGKTLRGTMKKIADDDAWTMPATIDDPAVLLEIAAALQRRLSRGGESKLQELHHSAERLA